MFFPAVSQRARVAKMRRRISNVGGIEFDDGQSAEQILRGIEQIVIVDFGVLAEDPALRPCVGLRRFALDLVAQSVLALVGVGQIGAVEESKTPARKAPGKQKRHRRGDRG